MNIFSTIKERINIVTIYVSILAFALMNYSGHMIYGKFFYNNEDDKYAQVCAVSQTSGCVPEGVSLLFFPKSQGGMFDQTSLTLSVPSILKSIDAILSDLDTTTGIKQIYGVNTGFTKKPLKSVSDILTNQKDGLSVISLSLGRSMIAEILMNNGDVYGLILDRHLNVSKQLVYKHQD